MWRDFFYFSKQDRRAILLLLLLIAVLLLAMWRIPPRHSYRLSEAVVDSLFRKDSTTLSLEKAVPFHPFFFDPNEADSTELTALGLGPFVTRNILKYRAAGGRFRHPKDFSRIYGLSDTLYESLKDYIQIREEGRIAEKQMEVNELPFTAVPVPASAYADYMKNKYKPGQFVDLNRADTADLIRIPGIGQVYAQMIVDYRKQLGGFYSLTQLRDLESLPENLGDWLYLNPEPCRKICINQLSLRQLMQHPYINYYQAKVIVEHRKREGKLKVIRQLSFYEEFSEKDIQRLEPYLSFE